jgi:hypothetical protein
VAGLLPNGATKIVQMAQLNSAKWRNENRPNDATD